MDHLELVRVHDTGTALVVRTPDGTEYLLALDEALKRSVKAPRTNNVHTPVPADAPLAPREIQARIRAGATAAEVAEESGTPLENVLRYEGPVLAERDYIARQARDVEVSAPLGHEGYRAAFGDEPASLGEMVHTRLRSFGVDPSTLVWDAWKLDAGTWRVVARFDVPESGAAIGEEPPASWTFHPARRHLENANRWGQVLSEWEPWDVLPTQRRLVPVSDQPFDIETSEPLEDESSAPAQHEQHRDERDDLLDVLSRRRGTRVGEDAEGDDALAHLIARSHQDREAREARDERPEPHGTTWKRDSAWNHAEASDTPEVNAPEAEQEADETRQEPRRGPWGRPAEQRGEGGPERTDGLREPDGLDRSWPPLRRVPDPIPASRLGDGGALADDEDGAARPHKKRRSQVPSWDEIVFGRSAKGDEDPED